MSVQGLPQLDNWRDLPHSLENNDCYTLIPIYGCRAWSLSQHILAGNAWICCQSFTLQHIQQKICSHLGSQLRARFVKTTAYQNWLTDWLKKRTRQFNIDINLIIKILYNSTKTSQHCYLAYFGIYGITSVLFSRTKRHHEGFVFVPAESGVWSIRLVQQKDREIWWTAGCLLHTAGSHTHTKPIIVLFLILVYILVSASKFLMHKII